MLQNIKFLGLFQSKVYSWANSFSPKGQKYSSSGIKSSLAHLVRQWTSDPEMRLDVKVGVQAQVRTVCIWH